MLNSTCSVSALWKTSGAKIVPPSPTGFSVSADQLGSTYVVLTFTDVLNATSYTVTATPTTNTFEAATKRTFTSGTGYKLGVLIPGTQYSLSLVASNSSGSSNPVTTTITTPGINTTYIPTFTASYTTFNNLTFSANNGYYSYISIPKTVPNNIYWYAFNDVVGTVNYPQLLYSSDSGASFIDISGRLKFSNGVNQNSSYGAGLACSDNGTFVYVQPSYHRVNYSRDSGATFNYNTGDLGAILPSDNLIAYSLRTNTTGEIIFVAGVVSTGAVNKIAWSNDSGNTYKNLSCSNYTCIEVNSSTNRIYIGGTAMNGAATINNLYYYTAPSKANLLSLDFSAITFTMVTINATTATRVIKISSVGNLTVLLTNDASKKVYLSTDGITFNSVTYFQTSNAGNTLSCEPRSLICIEPYVGFILIGDTTRIFYSLDSGSTWNQYTSLPTTSAYTSSTCYSEDNKLNVVISSTSSTEIKLYKMQTPLLFKGSMYFSGTNALVETSSGTTSKYAIGTSPYTIEAWIYPTETTRNSQGVLAITSSDGNNSGGIGLYLEKNGTQNTGRIRVDAHGLSTVSTTTAISPNTWTHIAFVRTSTSQAYLYVNGNSYNITDGNVTGRNITEDRFTIGARFSNTSSFNLGGLSFIGYISQVRFSKIAVYTAAFTPPSILKTTQSSGTGMAALASSNVISLIHAPTYLPDTTTTTYVDIADSGATFSTAVGLTTTMSVPTRNNLCNY